MNDEPRVDSVMEDPRPTDGNDHGKTEGQEDRETWVSEV